jgi:hypothetical protein
LNFKPADPKSDGLLVSVAIKLNQTSRSFSGPCPSDNTLRDIDVTGARRGAGAAHASLNGQRAF